MNGELIVPSGRKYRTMPVSHSRNLVQIRDDGEELVRTHAGYNVLYSTVCCSLVSRRRSSHHFCPLHRECYNNFLAICKQ